MRIFQMTKTFSTKQKSIELFERVRWQGKVSCVYCQSHKVCKHKDSRQNRWQCWNCKKSFSVTQGTIFHDTRLPLHKWFMLITLMLNAKKGLSSCQAARDLGMRQPTVWSMMHRIRKAMETDQAQLLQDVVEMDETSVSNDKDDDDMSSGSQGAWYERNARC